MARDGAIWVLMTGEALAPVKAARGDFDGWMARALGRDRGRSCQRSGRSRRRTVAVAGRHPSGWPAVRLRAQEIRPNSGFGGRPLARHMLCSWGEKPAFGHVE